MTHPVRDLGGPVGLADAAGVPSLRPAAAVAAAALDQQAAGEEDGAGGGQLLPQVGRVVAGGAAVSLDVVVEAVEFTWIGGPQGGAASDMLHSRLWIHFSAVAAHLKTQDRLRSIPSHTRSIASFAPDHRPHQKKQTITGRAGRFGQSGKIFLILMERVTESLEPLNANRKEAGRKPVQEEAAPHASIVDLTY